MSLSIYFGNLQILVPLKSVYCYHVDISHFGVLVNRISQLYFTIILRRYFIFNNQIPYFIRHLAFSKYLINLYRKGELKENIMIVDGNNVILKKII